MRVAGLTAYDFTSSSRGRSRVLGNKEFMELGMGREMLFKLASWHWHIVLVSKLGSGCYGVDRRCGVAEVKGVAELLGYGVEWRSGVGGVRS